MNIRRINGITRCIVIGFALGLAACGGGDDDESGAAGTQPAPTPPGIGAAGGTVLGPNGSKVAIPNGALAVVTQIDVDLTAAGAPPLPAGLTPIGQMFAFTPHGTAFAVPATITMPFDPATVAAGATPALFKTNAQNQWEKVANATFGASSVSGSVTSFSDFQIVTEDFIRSDANRTLTFFEMHNFGVGFFGGQRLAEVDRHVDFGTDTVKVHDFGRANFDEGFALFDGTEVVRNDIANGVVAVSADGRTFQVATEAPLGNANVEGEAVGSESKLVQDMTFIKRREDATLSFTMPLARIETHDENAELGRNCPEDFIVCNPIQGFLSYEIEAFRTDLPGEIQTFFSIGGTMIVRGLAEHWKSSPSTALTSRLPMWKNTDFDFIIEDLNGTSDSRALLTLRVPHTFVVDLSSIEVGKQFQVHIEAIAAAYNRLAAAPSERPTSAGAYMNFAAPSTGGGGGAMFESSGLEQVETLSPPPDPPPPIVPPPPCVPGPGAAGTLQFTQSSYVTRETDLSPPITVTRTGGTSGTVTALFTTSDGTAADGTDYDGVAATVFFSDGDDEPRVVEIAITEDGEEEPNETVILTLSQPGGCGALGSQDTAVLTIIDDDAGPAPSGLDLGFDGDGKAALDRFGGDRSGMAVQPDGKVVMVGGTFSNFIMARFNADGTLDENFGDSGKVTTPIPGAEALGIQEALAVAIQRDGRIVVAGNARTPSPASRAAIALVRYDSDGSIDETFGSGGFAFGPTFLFGRAFAVAIDGNDRIVVAGDTPKAGNTDFGDFIVARFSANGSIDSTFGEAGIAVTDIGGVTNEAHGLKVLSDNSILVSGFAPLVVSNSNGTTVQSEPVTAVARYKENGTLETTFGSGGRVQLNGDNVGRGLAVQSDGRIVLAGSIDIATFPATQIRFALMRLLANGTIDNSFGDAGRVQTSFTDRGDAAFGVALQADGKIVAAGASNIQINSNFAVARYESDGDLDTTFSEDGTLTIDFFGSTDVAENVAIQSNGKIVLGGLARNSVDGYGVARVLP